MLERAVSFAVVAVLLPSFVATPALAQPRAGVDAPPPPCVVRAGFRPAQAAPARSGERCRFRVGPPAPATRAILMHDGSALIPLHPRIV